MKYKGYTIRAYGGELDKPSFRLSGAGIFAPDGKLLSIAQDRELAIRAIDAHTKSGLWPNYESGTVATVSPSNK